MTGFEPIIAIKLNVKINFKFTMISIFTTLFHLQGMLLLHAGATRCNMLH